MSDRLGGGIEGLLAALTGGRDGADGLGALVGRLRQGGMAEEVDSWVGTGANRDVAPDQLAQAFGPDELAGLAQRFGLGGGATGGQMAGGGAMAAILAQLLPQLINGLTPQGRVPQNDSELGGGGIGGVLAQLTGGGAQSTGGLAGMLGALMGGGGGGNPAGGIGGLLGGLLGGDAAGTPGGASAAPGGGLDKSHLGDDGGGPLPRKPPSSR